ncbi:hypothetical protein LINPERPRIM_LOCUS37942 [Linum perenne]
MPCIMIHRLSCPEYINRVYDGFSPNSLLSLSPKLILTNQTSLQLRSLILGSTVVRSTIRFRLCVRGDERKRSQPEFLAISE